MQEFKQITFPDNRILSGLKKTSTGALIVDDQDGLIKYRREKELYRRVAKLEQQVATLLELLTDKELQDQ